MTDQGWITIAIVVLLAAVCGLVAAFFPRARPVFWIAGLSFGLLVFGGWTVSIGYIGISHRHLNGKGVLMLLTNGYVAWLILHYLWQVLKAPASIALQVRIGPTPPE